MMLVDWRHRLDGMSGTMLHLHAVGNRHKEVRDYARRLLHYPLDMAFPGWQIQPLPKSKLKS